MPMPGAWRSCAAALAVAALLAVSVPGCGGRSAGEGGAAAAAGGAGADAAGAPAAPVAWADLDGLRAALAERRGRPVLLNFWATWCVPCVEELPDLARLARQSEGVVALLGVSFDGWVSGDGPQTENKVKGFLSVAGATYPNLIYRGDQDPVLEAFDLSGAVPYSILYDAEGRVVERWDGQVDPRAVRRAIDGLGAGGGKS
jgi:thiol-disulfide isomerase/thioredoxin